LPIVVGGTGLYIDALLYNFSFASKGADRDAKNPRHLTESARGTKEALSPGTVIIGLDPGREVLNRRIKERAADMKKSGVLKEAEWLKQSYGWDAPGASGTIHRALRAFFEEGTPLDKCFEEAERADRRYAKRQRTWFKRNKDVQWFGVPKTAEQFLSSIL
jgi:tRNA dimethylallyltransferase